MTGKPLKSLDNYSRFVVESLNRPTVKRSTVTIWSDSRYTGVAEGNVFFSNGIRLRLREELDFDANLIASYGYEVCRGEQRLFWYDDFPHPNDADLTSTLPHHKHVPPDIKNNRIPAPHMTFVKPNLPVLIKEIEQLCAKFQMR